MSRKIFLSVLLSSFLLVANANETYHIVYLTIDITTAPAQGGPAKTPTQPLCIYQDGHILDFGTNFAGCTVSLLEEDETTVFSGFVGTDGFLILPGYLEGIYLIQLNVDGTIYEGVIEL